MLNINDVLALRDLALDHLPKVTAQRDIAAQHSRRNALSVVTFSTMGMAYSPASRAIELHASQLLALVGKFPETHTERFNYDVEGGAFPGELTGIMNAHRDRPLMEGLLLDAGRELCRLPDARRRLGCLPPCSQ